MSWVSPIAECWKEKANWNEWGKNVIVSNLVHSPCYSIYDKAEDFSLRCEGEKGEFHRKNIFSIEIGIEHRIVSGEKRNYSSWIKFRVSKYILGTRVGSNKCVLSINIRQIMSTIAHQTDGFHYTTSYSNKCLQPIRTTFYFVSLESSSFSMTIIITNK